MSLFDTGTDNAPKFEDLVGADKKYKTPEDAAKALLEKDSFIEQLKRETAELRQEITARPAVDRSQEILDQLEALKRAVPATERREPSEPERVEVKGLTLEDVDRVLTEREKKTRAEANINMVKAELQKAYADKYGQALKTMAEKNGLSEKALNDLAANSPQLVLNLMGQVKVDGTGFVPPSSSVNVGSFTPTAGKHQPRSYYLRLKETDKIKYLSKPVQQQMYNDAMALKEDFEDVNE